MGREFGPLYAALAVTRKLASKLPELIDDRLLAIEGRRGVLGDAHRRWSGHSVTTNREVWSGWDWDGGGEEWSSSPQWKASLIEEVLVPATAGAGRVLEIGPGAGRWTEALYEQADELILADITDTTLELCRRRLGDPSGVVYLQTDGASLRGIAAGPSTPSGRSTPSSTSPRSSGGLPRRDRARAWAGRRGRDPPHRSPPAPRVAAR